MRSPPPSPLAAVITAGGASRRFGSDKALARLDGQTLLERVALSLPACSPRLIVTPPGKYVLGGWLPVPDTRPGEGPLAGLEAGLGALDPGTWTAFSAVDLPHLTPEFWRRLAAFVRPGGQVVIGLSADGRRQPLAALYHTSALGQVTALLDAGERRMLALLERVRVVEVSWAELEETAPRAYRNVNRQEDLG
ncbi:molybdenum cofactor guanylyltransferase [Deinococcus alpinitundrae]|uniref:molybdenum cofactor guanylyltransferase n=1 Tax=Deinococcus alpinitundrae TaxID=468913 RepID=UPI00137A04E9|nr:molybdenum cofactor guanylyltransferase [Deinococcus alpinitundrae]